MAVQEEKQKHEIRVQMRRELYVSGVSDVESFDGTGILLHTAEGELTVEGSDLRIGVLDTDRGVVTVTGQISGMFYGDETAGEKKGLFKRIFR